MKNLFVVIALLCSASLVNAQTAAVTVNTSTGAVLNTSPNPFVIHLTSGQAIYIDSGASIICNGTATGFGGSGGVSSFNTRTGAVALQSSDLSPFTLNSFASTTSSQLASVISDETGSGPLVFGISPALTGSPTINGVALGALATVVPGSGVATAAASTAGAAGGLQLTTGLRTAPPNSCVVLIGDSYSAGVPINSVDGTLNYATGYVGPGMCYPQYMSLDPFFYNTPVFSYGIAGSQMSNAQFILAGSGTIHGTEYMNGSVVGTYGGITSSPSVTTGSFTGTKYGYFEYGINDMSSGISTGTFTALLNSAVATWHSYGSSYLAYAMTVPSANANSLEPIRYAYNNAIRAQFTGTYTGTATAMALDGVAPVGEAFSSRNNTIFSDGLHLNDLGYHYYARIAVKVASESSSQYGTWDPNPYENGTLFFSPTIGNIDMGGGNGSGNGHVYIYHNGNTQESLYNDSTALVIGSFAGPKVSNINTSTGSATTMASWDSNFSFVPVYPVKINSPTGTLTGSISGSVVFTQPLAGTGLKTVLLNCSSLSGTATGTFTTAFSSPPGVIVLGGPNTPLSTAVITALSTTNFTATGTGTATTGVLEIIGQ